MKQPESLLALAISGTSRFQHLPDSPHSMLADAWSVLKESDLVEGTLKAAAIEGIAMRAGYQPVKGIELLDPAPVEKYRKVDNAAVSAAQRMIQGEFAQGWTEWLLLCKRNGCIVPPRLLPAILDLGSRQRAQRSLICQVIGERGFWLAKQQSQWSWVLEAADVTEEAWEFGDPAERLSWLRQERARDPLSAIKALQATWSSESGEMRDAITQLAVETTLEEDEIWLEELALKDRRQSVRQAAIRSLTSIPDSSFQKRARKRLSEIIEMDKRRLTLKISDVYQQEWRDDAIQEKPPGNKGQKAWWAKQILAQNPIHAWTDILGMSISELVNSDIDADWREFVYETWVDSMEQFPDKDFLIHFLPKGLRDAKAQKASQKFATRLPLIFSALPATEIADVLESVKLGDALTIELLARFQPELLTQHKRLNRVIQSWLRDKQTYSTRPIAESLAFCIYHTTISSLLTDIAKLPELSANAETFARTLEFRQSYISQINSSETNQS